TKKLKHPRLLHQHRPNRPSIWKKQTRSSPACLASQSKRVRALTMQRTLAISFLTLKAAFRYRLILVLSAVLLAGVIILPLIIKDDGTARGFTQIVLTYTL